VQQCVKTPKLFFPGLTKKKKIFFSEKEISGKTGAQLTVLATHKHKTTCLTERKQRDRKKKKKPTTKETYCNS
jgi:hypothetical protein